MSNKTIAQLDAKTPANTDLVPVADPVTGIAGKSTWEQFYYGAKFDGSAFTFDPPLSQDIRAIGFNNSYSATTFRASSASIIGDLPQPLTTLSNSITGFLTGTGQPDSESKTQTITINGTELAVGGTTQIQNATNAISVNAPNLKKGALNFTNFYKATSFSFPEIELGLFTISTTPSLTSINLSKLKGGTLRMQNFTKLSSVNLPEFVQGVLDLSFSVGGAPNLATISVPKLKYAIQITIANTIVTNFSFPELETVTSAIQIMSSTTVSVDMPKAKVIPHIFHTATSFTALTTMNCPALIHTINGIANTSSSVTLPLLTSIDLPELISSSYPTYSISSGINIVYTFPFANNLNIGSAPNLTLINLPKIQFMISNSGSFGSAGNSVNITGASNLANFNLNPTPKYIKGDFVVTGAALNQASVDGILVALAYMDGTANAPYPAYSSRIVNLSGGTSATPSATGLAAKATLVARGCTVTHN